MTNPMRHPYGPEFPQERPTDEAIAAERKRAEREARILQTLEGDASLWGVWQSLRPTAGPIRTYCEILQEQLNDQLEESGYKVTITLTEPEARDDV